MARHVPKWSRAAGVVVVAVLGLLGAPRLDAQGTTTASGTASATIAGAIRITNRGDLAFGEVLSGASAGTVSVSVTIGRTPTVTRTAAGGANLMGTAYSAATFYIQQTGSWWPWVRVTLPSGPITLTRVGGGA
ncbi:MAG: DUF4402 domain-containing protein, partial [Deltaproteobacteria bacterium]|nr:DUF4402 domain-containing protein [Deltaproteobacteria bacterium]